MVPFLNRTGDVDAAAGRARRLAREALILGVSRPGIVIVVLVGLFC